MKKLLGFVAAVSALGAGATAAEVSLDEGRLAGKWCLEYVESGGEKDIENINYEFLPGGKFRYQTSSMSDGMSDGTYEISGNELHLKPTMRKLKVQTLTEGEMTAKWFMMHHFSRGPCS
jgi:uncharacterized protein (TIGR03066 family)